MKPDYEKEIRDNFPEYEETLNETTRLTDEFGKILAINSTKIKFLETCLENAKISVDTVKCILNMLKQGFIAQSIVLLRWYLELAHLLYYLWKNPSEHEKWLAGMEIRPQQIGKFFESEGLPTWQETYKEWSSFVHGNSIFVSNFDGIWARRQFSENKLLLIGNILAYLNWITHKFNNVFGKVLKEYQVEHLDEMIKKYNSLEDKIISINESQLELEKRIMNS